MFHTVAGRSRSPGGFRVDRIVTTFSQLPHTLISIQNAKVQRRQVEKCDWQ